MKPHSQNHNIVIAPLDQTLINRLKVGAEAVTMMSSVESQAYRTVHLQIDTIARDMTTRLFKGMKPSKELFKMTTELNKLVALRIFLAVEEDTTRAICQLASS